MPNQHTYKNLPDLNLVHEAQQLGSGEYIHDLNNILQVYLGLIETIKNSKGKIYQMSKGKRNKIMEEIDSHKCKLRCYVLSKRMEKYNNYGWKG